VRWIALGLFATFFLLMDGADFFKWASNKIPLSKRIRLTLFTSFRDTSVSVITASVVDSHSGGSWIAVPEGFFGTPLRQHRSATSGQFASCIDRCVQ